MSDIPDKPLYIRLCYSREAILNNGNSVYPAVNLRKNGLKCPKNKTILDGGIVCKISEICSSNKEYDYLDLRSHKSLRLIHSLSFSMIYEVIDKKKFMLARIKFGI